MRYFYDRSVLYVKIEQRHLIMKKWKWLIKGLLGISSGFSFWSKQKFLKVLNIQIRSSIVMILILCAILDKIKIKFFVTGCVSDRLYSKRYQKLLEKFLRPGSFAPLKWSFKFQKAQSLSANSLVGIINVAPRQLVKFVYSYLRINSTTMTHHL